MASNKHLSSPLFAPQTRIALAGRHCRLSPAVAINYLSLPLALLDWEVQMPSVKIGTKVAVIRALSNTLNFEYEEVEMVIYFLYTNSYQTVCDRYRNKRGLSISSLQKKIPEAIHRISKALDEFEMLEPTLYNAEQNSLSPFFSSNVIGSIDTVPIHTWQMNNTYNPKYAGHVLKILTAVSNTGYILFCSTVYAGATHDLTIFKDCFAHLIPQGKTFLADGVFCDKSLSSLITPFDSNEIWRDGSEAAHHKLQLNEKIAHFRARVEHRFSAVQMNRFAVVNSKWRRQITNLNAIIKITCWVLNLELRLAHGPLRGCYAPVSTYSDQRISLLNAKFYNHNAMSSRYPEELAIAKAKKANEKKLAREAIKVEKAEEAAAAKTKRQEEQKSKREAAKKEKEVLRKAQMSARKKKMDEANKKRRIGGTNTSKRRKQ